MKILQENQIFPNMHECPVGPPSRSPGSGGAASARVSTVGLAGAGRAITLPGMDQNEELLKQLMLGMPPETRFRMQRFIRLVAERDECALSIIRQIEAGRVSPTDALDALERCQGARQ